MTAGGPISRVRRSALVKCITLGIATSVAVLLSSCSAPPPARQQAPAHSRPRIVHSTRTEPTARVAEEKQAPKVTTSEVKPETSRHSVRRLGGYPGEITHAAGSMKIALTFDAGASPAPTPSILKTLKEAGVQVTFFLTGKWCEQNPELVKEIVADGHEIGNHTYSHPDLRKLSDEAITQQLNQTEDIIMRLTGRSTKPYFRPPFGGRDKHVLSVAGAEGYTSVYWALDSLDAFKKGITSEEIESRILSKVEGGDIVLMHCGSAATAGALPDMIAKLQQRGYRIVKVSELATGD